ncbi:MAG: hypothetical protein KJ007_10245 [Burkholderiales bacterium]|nr:hypothetical protein [Burkholderiales bacterium]
MEIVTGEEIRKMLARVRAGLASYREVLLCSPFMDDATIGEVGEMLHDARNVGCDMHVVTRAGPARALSRYVARIARRSPVHVVNELHAKVYWVRGRGGLPSEAIVTSANLTRQGMDGNVELGVRLSSLVEMDRSALLDIRRRVEGWLQ